MINLYPGNNFAFVRQIADHTDSTTYYVRVVIRDAYTDAIIETLDLDSKGSQRYSKQWKVPADPSGQGFYVSVVSSVYTDSDHTTKSTDYGDEENTYLVVDRPRNLGGGSSLVGRDVSDIVRKEIADIVPSISKMFEDLFRNSIEKDSVMTAKINEIFKCVKEIEAKEDPEAPEATDLSPVIEAIKAVEAEVRAIDTNVDLTPITDILEANKEEGEVTNEEMQMALKGIESNIKKALDNTGTDILKKLKDNMSFASTQIFHPVYNKPEDKKEDSKEKEDMAEKEIDLSKLTD